MADEPDIREYRARLRGCLEQLFSDNGLQNSLLSGQLELTLAEYPAGQDSKGRRLFRRYILAGSGVRCEVDCKQEKGFRYSVYEIEREGRGRVIGEYRFHLPNAARALAHDLARESKGSLKPEMIEERIKNAINRAKSGAG